MSEAAWFSKDTRRRQGKEKELKRLMENIAEKIDDHRKEQGPEKSC